MRKFIQRALNKLSKLNEQQIHALMYDLARSNDQMETVLDSIADGILVSDQNNRVILVNKAAERLISAHEQEDSEKIIWDVIDDKDIADFAREIISREEPSSDREFTLQDPYRILSVKVMPLVRKGEVHGNLIHIKDISEKRFRETRLRRAENLASLTNLTAAVAHEIKNPLGSISIHIQLMERILTTDKNSELRKYLDIIDEEVDRLNRIVMDFLFAVRPIDISFELHDLNILLHETLDFLKYELEEAKIGLREKYQTDIPHILLDEKFIRQAVLNIVKNAINAMPHGGALTVQTHFSGSEVQLKIGDTGCGMNEDIMEKIFEPYFTTREFGSGIGLTIVYKIIKEHSGDISVISKENEGSTFLLSFPVPDDQRHLLKDSPCGGEV